MANLLTTRPQGALPSTTEVNPKEQCQAITLRSGREIEKSVEKEEPQLIPQKEKENSDMEKDTRPREEEKEATPMPCP